MTIKQPLREGKGGRRGGRRRHGAMKEGDRRRRGTVGGKKEGGLIPNVLLHDVSFINDR